MSEGEAISVVVRCRPFIKNEAKDYEDVVRVDTKEGVVRVGDSSKSDYDPKNIETWRLFTFDTVFGKKSKQTEVYDKAVLSIFDKVWNGFNGTVFCYGQTSSGKTHTMMGDLNKAEEYGIIPQITNKLFSKMKFKEEKEYDFSVTLSFLEIYNEKVFDLLTSSPGSKKRKELKIRQTKSRGFHVPGLSQFEVKNEAEMFKLIKAGFNNRSVSATNYNDASSRSHSMLTINFQKSPKEGSSKIAQGKLVSKLNLVDLAGSEKYQSGATDGGALGKESRNINQSLSSLAKVIKALSQKKKTFVPYRDSSLTKLLKESLGGSASTLMFANINPCDRNALETVSTLRYAASAKKIKNKPKVQIYLDPKNKRLKELQDEVDRLKQQLASRDRTIASLQETDTGSGLGKKDVRDANDSKQIEKEMMALGAPELDFLTTKNQELQDELNDTRQREFELDQEIEALTAEVRKMERKEIEYEDKAILLQKSIKQSQHREQHLMKQAEKYQALLKGKFKKESEERKLQELYKNETESLKKEKEDMMQMLEDSRIHEKYLDDQLEQERQAKDDALRIANQFKSQADERRKRLSQEKERVDDLCEQLVEVRRALELERIASEQAKKTIEDLKKMKGKVVVSNGSKDNKNERRPSFVITIDQSTKSKLNGLVTPGGSRNGSPRNSISSVTTGTTAMSGKSRRAIASLSKMPRKFRRSLLFESEEKKLNILQATWANSLAQYLNICLETQTDLIVAGLIPIKIGSTTTIRQMGDPLLMAGLLNYVGRSKLKTYIDESRLASQKLKKELTLKEKVQDFQLVLGACKAAGVDIGKVNAMQLVEREQKNGFSSQKYAHENVLNVIQRIIEFQLSQTISTLVQPELVGLGAFKEWGMEELKPDAVAKLKPKELLLRWVNINLHKSVQLFDEHGQNLEAILSQAGITLPLVNFSDNWGMMVTVLIIAGLIARSGSPEAALSFAAQVMTMDDIDAQQELVEYEMRMRGGGRALSFFLGEIDLNDLTAKDQEFVCEKLNSLFSMVVLNEDSGFKAEGKEHQDGDYTDEELLGEDDPDYIGGHLHIDDNIEMEREYAHSDDFGDMSMNSTQGSLGRMIRT